LSLLPAAPDEGCYHAVINLKNLSLWPSKSLPVSIMRKHAVSFYITEAKIFK